MKNQIALIIIITSLILALTFQVLAQEKTDGFNFSVSIDNTNFGVSRKPIIKVRLENKTGSTVYLNNSEPVWLNFEKLDKPLDKGCRRSDCFVAFVSFKDKHIEKNQSIEAEFDLRDFYWMDAVSSNIDFEQPKNFFETVRFGKYRFYAFVRIPPHTSKFDESKFILLQSNVFIVSM